MTDKRWDGDRGWRNDDDNDDDDNDASTQGQNYSFYKYVFDDAYIQYTNTAKKKEIKATITVKVWVPTTGATIKKKKKRQTHNCTDLQWEWGGGLLINIGFYVLSPAYAYLGTKRGRQREKDT